MERHKSDRIVAMEYAMAVWNEWKKVPVGKERMPPMREVLFPNLIQEFLNYNPPEHVYGSKGWGYELELLRNRLHRNIDNYIWPISDHVPSTIEDFYEHICQLRQIAFQSCGVPKYVVWY